MDTAAPAASSEGEINFDPDDKRASDFCNPWVLSPRVRAVKAEDVLVLIITDITPSFELVVCV